MIFRKIDPETGLFLEDVWADAPAADLIATPVPSGLYWPKWDGSKWIEGKTAAEIAEYRAAKVIVASFETNRLSIEDYLKTAIKTDKDYLAIASTTTSDQKQQINRLTRQNIRMMRWILKQFDSAE